MDYRDVVIEKDSIVYCDIPYKDTILYLIDFCHDDFFDWAASRNFPVYISEYDIKDNRFKLVYEIEKRSLFVKKSRLKGNEAMEKLYWNGVSN